jgi:hypothetical protein
MFEKLRLRRVFDFQQSYGFFFSFRTEYTAAARKSDA